MLLTSLVSIELFEFCAHLRTDRYRFAQGTVVPGILQAYSLRMHHHGKLATCKVLEHFVSTTPVACAGKRPAEYPVT